MTKRDIGRAYLNLLYKDGWVSLASNLSEEAAFDLYEELERFGVHYYADLYSQAEVDEANGFKESSDKLNDLFRNRSKYLLKLSGKDSEYIEKNYEDFAKKLLSYCASEKVGSIHNVMNLGEDSLKQILAEFGENEEVKDMSMDLDEEVVQEDEVFISTPLEFMELIEGTIEYYDGLLSSDDYSDDEKDRIRSNKDKMLTDLNSKLIMFLDGRAKASVDAVSVGSEEDIRKLEEDIKMITSIYREYFHDEDRAREIEEEFAQAISNDYTDESDYDESVVTAVDDSSDLQATVSTVDLPDNSEEVVPTSEVTPILVRKHDAELENYVDEVLNMIDNEKLFFGGSSLDDEIEYFIDVANKIEMDKREIADKDLLKSITDKQIKVLSFLGELKSRVEFKLPEEVIDDQVSDEQTISEDDTTSLSLAEPKHLTDTNVEVVDNYLDKTLNMIENENLFFGLNDLEEEIKYFKDVIDRVETLKRDVTDEEMLSSINERENLILSFVENLEDRKILRVPSSDVEVLEDDEVLTFDNAEAEDVDDLSEELDGFDVITSMSNEELSDRAKYLVSQIRNAQRQRIDIPLDLKDEIRRIQSEMDRRLSLGDKSDVLDVPSTSKPKHFKSEPKHFKSEPKHFKSDLDVQVDKIQNSKHFTPEVKEQLIAELYEQMGKENNMHTR